MIDRSKNSICITFLIYKSRKRKLSPHYHKNRKKSYRLICDINSIIYVHIIKIGELIYTDTDSLRRHSLQKQYMSYVPTIIRF